MIFGKHGLDAVIISLGDMEAKLAEQMLYSAININNGTRLGDMAQTFGWVVKSEFAGVEVRSIKSILKNRDHDTAWQQAGENKLVNRKLGLELVAKRDTGKCQDCYFYACEFESKFMRTSMCSSLERPDEMDIVWVRPEPKVYGRTKEAEEDKVSMTPYDRSESKKSTQARAEMRIKEAKERFGLDEFTLSEYGVMFGIVEENARSSLLTYSKKGYVSRRPIKTGDKGKPSFIYFFTEEQLNQNVKILNNIILSPEEVENKERLRLKQAMETLGENWFARTEFRKALCLKYGTAVNMLNSLIMKGKVEEKQIPTKYGKKFMYRIIN